jgi:hypothetical protein
MVRKRTDGSGQGPSGLTPLTYRLNQMGICGSHSLSATRPNLNGATTNCFVNRIEVNGSCDPDRQQAGM